jgi:hypothetical protein
VGPTCRREEERGEGEVGRRWLLGREGRWAGGLLRMRAEKKEEWKEVGRGRKGRERGFDLFFLFFFKSF